MLELLTNIGYILTATMALVVLTIYLIMRITWRCGLCGKMNTTGILRFIFCMCDHEGDT